MPTSSNLSLNSRYYMAAVITDIFVVCLALAISIWIRFGRISACTTSEFIGTASFFFLGYYMVSVIENLYSVRTNLNRSMLLYRILRMTFAVTGSFMLLIFVIKDTPLLFINSRFVIVFNMIIWLVLTIIMKLIVLPNIFKSLYGGKRSHRSNLLIAGNPSRNRSITALFKKSAIYSTDQRIIQWPNILPESHTEIVKTVLEQISLKKCSGAIVLFDERHSFDCIAKSCIELFDTGIPFVIYGPNIQKLGYFDPWFSLNDFGAITFLKKGKKRIEFSLTRVIDVSFAFLALILLSPLLFITGVLVKFSSPGSIFFKQNRVGLSLIEFSFLKFRSMREGKKNVEAHKEYFKNYANGKAADNGKTTFKLKQTSQVTQIGRIIRKTSIDELPQLINILRGEMSLVGPRPCIPYELEHYNDWQRRRFSVRPGLTGIWQVYGRSRLPFDEAQFLDFLYTIDSSHSLDFRLIAKTIPVVLFGKGGV